MIRPGATVALSLTLAVPAIAQLKVCTPPQVQGSYHMFVDDFRFSDEAAASTEMKTLRNVFHTSVKDQLDAMKVQNVPGLRTLECPGRFPQPGDFTRSPVEWMDNRDVVMELWTVIRQVDQQRFEAEFNVAIIPAVLLNLGGAATPALFSIRYPLNQNQRHDQLLALLRNHPELTAYAFIGAGLRAVENRDYDYASSFLCRGLTELQHAPDTPDNKKLIAYVDDATAKVVANAKRDRDYLGPLKLLLPGSRTGCTR